MNVEAYRIDELNTIYNTIQYMWRLGTGVVKCIAIFRASKFLMGPCMGTCAILSI